MTDLMKERFEVIADYPNSPFKIGMICQLTEIHPYSGMSFIYDDVTVVSPEWFVKYPAIFKPLAWYEEREINELPEYLLNSMHKMKTGETEVLKVVKYEPYYVDDAPIPHWSFYAYPEWNPNEGFPMIFFEPATETDYLTYLNSKK